MLRSFTALSVLCMAHAIVPNPLGHRVYSYSANYTDAIRAFNSDPKTVSKISHVNVYGGSFSRIPNAYAGTCLSSPSSPGQTMLVTNSGPVPVTVLQKVPDSTGKYVKCSVNVAAPVDASKPTEVLLTMDPNFEFMLFVSTVDGKELDQECYTATEGVPPARLDFPMSSDQVSKACAAPRGSPPPPLLPRFDYLVDTKPQADIAKWGTVPGVEGLTVTLDGRAWMRASEGVSGPPLGLQRSPRL